MRWFVALALFAVSLPVFADGIPLPERRVRMSAVQLRLDDGIAPVCWKMNSKLKLVAELDEAQEDLEQDFQDAVSRQDAEKIRATMDHLKLIQKAQQGYQNEANELAGDLKQIEGGTLTARFDLVAKATIVRITDAQMAARDTVIQSAVSVDADNRGGKVQITLNGLGACEASAGQLEQALPGIELKFTKPATEKSSEATDSSTLYFSSSPAFN